MLEPLEFFIIGLNILTFLLMGYDKRASRANMRRIPENLFFLLAAPGGSAGVWLGMKAFRHKTKHIRFVYGIPLLVVVHTALLLFFSMRAG